jgi:hypothetical protein
MGNITNWCQQMKKKIKSPVIEEAVQELCKAFLESILEIEDVTGTRIPTVNCTMAYGDREFTLKLDSRNLDNDDNEDLLLEGDDDDKIIQ